VKVCAYARIFFRPVATRLVLYRVTRNIVFLNDAPALILQDTDKYGVTGYFEGERMTRIDLCANDI
jgi:hypothetical protein